MNAPVNYQTLDVTGPKVHFDDWRLRTHFLNNAVIPSVVVVLALATLAGLAISCYYLFTTTHAEHVKDPETGERTAETKEVSNGPFSVLVGAPVVLILLTLGFSVAFHRIWINECKAMKTTARNAYITRLFKDYSIAALYKYHRIDDRFLNDIFENRNGSLVAYVPEIYKAEEAKTLNALFDRYAKAAPRERKRMELEWETEAHDLAIFERNRGVGNDFTE